VAALAALEGCQQSPFEARRARTSG
jgi:hypothetical protein